VGVLGWKPHTPQDESEKKNLPRLEDSPPPPEARRGIEEKRLRKMKG
jgi:hypothetical protein